MNDLKIPFHTFLQKFVTVFEASQNLFQIFLFLYILADGLIIFQLYDIINPGCVKWTKVTRKFSRMKKFMEKLENCNYVVELGRKQKFSLVGIAGQDINDGNSTLTLALVWQLMRSYTLSVLSSLNQSSNAKVEQEIIKWVNTKLEEAGKDSKIHSFQDSKIATAKPIIDLIDAIKPGVINYELLQDSGGTYEVLRRDINFYLLNDGVQREKP